jgi:hypothetical protein
MERDPEKMAELGRRGAAARERNWLERVTAHREELDKMMPDALKAHAGIIQGEVRPGVLPAITAVYDRVGLGPTSKTEVTVGPSEALASLIERLDQREREATAVDVDAVQTEEPRMEASQRPSLAQGTDALALRTTVDAYPASAPRSAITPNNSEGE